MNQKCNFLFIFLIATLYAGAQENSPFSRYGLGDIAPSQNIVNRAMAGITSTYTNSQSVNFNNPASYSGIRIVTYDIGLTLDSRTLRSASPVLKYNSVNLAPSYVALGMPLNRKRNLGLAFGLRPITRVSYNIQQSSRLRKPDGSASDSLLSIYEGDGGLYQGFVGIGKQWGNLKAGINTGLLFGRKESSTRTLPVDSVLTYKSNSSTTTSYNNLFVNFGLQYEGNINKTTSVNLGLSGNLKQSLRAKRTIVRETYDYDFNGSPYTIDSVYNSGEFSGTIELPVSYNAGISLNKFTFDRIGNRYDRAMIALEYEAANWSQFRSYGEADRLINSWQLKLGGQLTPDPLSIRSYWSRATYRAGVYMGKEAVNADGNTLPVVGLTLGAGLPVRKWRSFDNQYTIINTTFEIGKRGNKNNNITESFFRLSFGLNLSDIWFVKRKYD